MRNCQIYLHKLFDSFEELDMNMKQNSVIICEN